MRRVRAKEMKKAMTMTTMRARETKKVSTITTMIISLWSKLVLLVGHQPSQAHQQLDCHPCHQAQHSEHSSTGPREVQKLNRPVQLLNSQSLKARSTAMCILSMC